MQHSLKKLPKSTVELTIEISPDEMQPYLERAALKMGEETTIPGFRPGKAPFKEVLARFGAGRIWEEAAQLVVPKIFGETIQKEQLETIGSPSIDVIKLAPDNPFIFKATVALLPEVQLGDYSKIKFTSSTASATDSEVNKVIEDLRKMQTKETAVPRTATSGDKVVVDMTMSLDSVPLDGGTTKDHSIYLDEEYYVPGLKEKVIGLKKGDTKEFPLKFPKDHYQKMIAGKDVDFKIEVKDVFELQKPELDDLFAKALGQATFEGLQKLIRSNLEAEAKQKAEQRAEIELLEGARENTKFGDIPDILVNEETIKMLRELEEGIARQGMEFTEYLKRIGKDRDTLRLEFSPEAVKRVKTALLMRTLIKTHNITVSEAEVDEEVAHTLEAYKNSPDVHAQIKSPEARQYLRGMRQNRKAIEWLKNQTAA